MERILKLICVGVLLTPTVLFSADITITNFLLPELLPELKRPRLLVLKDLPTDDDRTAFKDYSYSFQLKADFNQDNVPDEAVAIHFESSAGDTSLVAILTKKNEKWQRQFTYRPKSDVTILKEVPHPDKEKAKKGLKAVLAQFTGMPSDNYIIIYWTGTEYKVLSGFDTSHWKGYDK